MSSQEKETVQEREITKKEAVSSSHKSSIFSLIETLGMFCLYAGLASIIIGYFWTFGFAFVKPTRQQIFEILVFAARGGLLFAIIIGLPMWLARQQDDNH